MTKDQFRKLLTHKWENTRITPSDFIDFIIDNLPDGVEVITAADAKQALDALRSEVHNMGLSFSENAITVDTFIAQHPDDPLNERKPMLSYDEVQLKGRTRELREARAEIKRLREALTPSDETKASYSGEFYTPLVIIDDPQNVVVGWPAIKEIMKAIRTFAEDPS